MARVLIAYGTHRLSKDSNGQPALEMHILSTVAQVESALLEKNHRIERAAFSRDPRHFWGRAKRYRPDVIFNLCEQVSGDCTLEKNAAAVFELGRFDYTGSRQLTLGLCQDKALTKSLLKSAKIPTPPFAVVPVGETIDDFELPAIVKPTRTDGSLGITARSVVKSRKALRRRVQYVHRWFKQPALVEAYVAGREFHVALLGNQDPEVLAVAELSYAGLPKHVPRICSYSAKWRPMSDYFRFTTPVLPAPVSAGLRRRLEESALAAHRLLGLRGYARVDFRAGQGSPQIIEVNPNPDISHDAGMTRAALHAGMSYPDLIDRIVQLGME
ncbi:MAG: ATP-grasp domain-containing protein [Deltaproteobacteria bacterium]|nr:ATP-grasp domain-containing protein [Deltaproteobacteria bacterium]